MALSPLKSPVPSKPRRNADGSVEISPYLDSVYSTQGARDRAFAAGPAAPAPAAPVAAPVAPPAVSMPSPLKAPPVDDPGRGVLGYSSYVNDQLANSKTRQTARGTVMQTGPLRGKTQADALGVLRNQYSGMPDASKRAYEAKGSGADLNSGAPRSPLTPPSGSGAGGGLRTGGLQTGGLRTGGLSPSPLKFGMNAPAAPSAASALPAPDVSGPNLLDGVDDMDEVLDDPMKLGRSKKKRSPLRAPSEMMA